MKTRSILLASTLLIAGMLSVTGAAIAQPLRPISVQDLPITDSSQPDSPKPNDSKPNDSKPDDSKLDATDLHPAFTFTRPDFEKWVKRGQEAAKKSKIQDVLSKGQRNPDWTRGKKGPANATVFFLQWEGTAIAVDVFRASNTYEKQPFAPDAFKEGGFFTRLDFLLYLVSEPKVDFRGGKAAAYISAAAGGTPTMEVVGDANPKEVQVLKVVLTDDQGNVYHAERTEGSAEERTTTFRGVNVNRTTGTASTTSSAYGSAYGAGGYVYGSAYGSSQSTVTINEFVPYSEKHPYYEATYKVSFPLFTPDGKPIIKAGVKELTLHIITEAGEMSVKYKLPVPKKK